MKEKKRKESRLRRRKKKKRVTSKIKHRGGENKITPREKVEKKKLVLKDRHQTHTASIQ